MRGWRRFALGRSATHSTTATTYGPTVRHTYSTAGTYHATVVLTDADGTSTKQVP